MAVEGAEPGDVLEVRIIDVQLRQDWGYNVIRPLAGTFPDEFDAYRHLNIPLMPSVGWRGCRGAWTCRCTPSSV